MSNSSLYLIDKETFGFEAEVYKNSWVFSPMIWDVLCQKYFADEIATPYGYRKGLIGPGGDELHRKLNDLMNASSNMTDRICWELSMQQGFFSKDKKLVSEAIKNFVVENATITVNNDGETLQEWHADRFNTIAEDVAEIAEEKYPYFVFKNTSVDDGVELLFEKYNEDEDEYLDCCLKDQTDYKLEFVIIADGLIKEFRNHDELEL